MASPQSGAGHHGQPDAAGPPVARTVARTVLPGPPGAPQLKQSAAQSLTLFWQPPERSGSEPTVGYQVLMQTGGMSGFTERVANTGSAVPEASIRNLAPKTWCAPSLALSQQLQPACRQCLSF